MIDLWIRNPKTYLRSALEEGFRRFTWNFPVAFSRRLELLSWFRLNAIGYTGVTTMVIDNTGAAEYSVYGEYAKPTAVYPVWDAMEDLPDTLFWLAENHVGNNILMCTDPKVDVHMRPVFGQSHRVVIHNIPRGTDPEHRREMLMFLRQAVADYPDCDFMISGLSKYSDLFGMGFTAVDYKPPNVLETGSFNRQLVLPSGKQLRPNSSDALDKRYADWFTLVGWHQSQLVEVADYTRFNMTSINWAWRNFDKVTPFTWAKSRDRNLPAGLIAVDDKSFVLPAARRRLMRNIGMQAGDADKFMCDACILHNACTLYREGSVCTVRGSSGMDIARQFSTRNAESIIGALGKLVERQAERLELAEAAEQASGEMDPEVTRMYKNVFDQGVKLAKLIDPKLAGGGVQVNVGVAGNAAVQVQSADPRQLVATLMAEFESVGIPRTEITSSMIKGALSGMAGDRTLKEAVRHTAAQMPTQQSAIEGKTV
jgi:hypothetical protein